MSKHIYGASSCNSYIKRDLEDFEAMVFDVENKKTYANKALKLLMDLCEIQTKSGNEEDMFEFLVEHPIIKQEGVKLEYQYKPIKNVWDATKKEMVKADKAEIANLYITKGEAESYPCFVAHADTVHKDVFDRSVLYANQTGAVLAYGPNGQVGVGGDDRVGIFFCLLALQRLPNVKVAIFHSEEIGCVGSKDADMDFFNNVNYVFQGDRRGNNEVIVHTNGAKIATDDFLNAILDSTPDSGYASGNGSITDVGQLYHNGLKCSAVNLGCGYYDAHSDRETINYFDCLFAFELAYNVCKAHPTKFFEAPKKLLPFTTSTKETDVDYTLRVKGRKYEPKGSNSWEYERGYVEGYNRAFAEATKISSEKTEKPKDMIPDGYTFDVFRNACPGCNDFICLFVNRSIKDMYNKDKYYCKTCGETFSEMQVNAANLSEL